MLVLVWVRVEAESVASVHMRCEANWQWCTLAQTPKGGCKGVGVGVCVSVCVVKGECGCEGRCECEANRQ